MKIAFPTIKPYTQNYKHPRKLLPRAYQSRWSNFLKTSIGGVSLALPSYHLCGWQEKGCLHRLCHIQLIDYGFGHCPEIEP